MITALSEGAYFVHAFHSTGLPPRFAKAANDRFSNVRPLNRIFFREVTNSNAADRCFVSRKGVYLFFEKVSTSPDLVAAEARYRDKEAFKKSFDKAKEAVATHDRASVEDDFSSLLIVGAKERKVDWSTVELLANDPLEHVLYIELSLVYQGAVFAARQLGAADFDDSPKKLGQLASDLRSLVCLDSPELWLVEKSEILVAAEYYKAWDLQGLVANARSGMHTASMVAATAAQAKSTETGAALADALNAATLIGAVAVVPDVVHRLVPSFAWSPWLRGVVLGPAILLIMRSMLRYVSLVRHWGVSKWQDLR